ncbi:PTS system mannose/fructose/sorbose family transporter subunit IID [Virgibacillus chiguensis]|uniref:PTS system, N-acetylgalactosamine-specific IID component n=1 Tax=Virgibacillus chiguensis TaxID=411959 RepID=A0A1M5QP48_9BACI|nr:PTS system mannose/fructose/sorbose family transporter subunit IID [Virgibacillus chiguensis]SHH15892.1 PTS system, N-acetylgalactosamine-specific IID component [Virgibacillus chiguensis]
MVSDVKKEQVEENRMQKVITKYDLFKMAFRSFFLQSSFNYERMQAGGWLYSILPALERVSKSKKELSEKMQRHLDFFNSHTFISTIILGMIAAMEEKKQDGNSIRAVKVAMMGPFGGIGDALIWLTLLPICAGIGVSLAMEGNVAGPIIFLLSFNTVHFLIRFGGIYFGYRSGINAMQKLKSGTKDIAHAATIVGITVVGALIASYVSIQTPLKATAGEAEIKIQEDLLDQIMPNLLPFGFTLLLYMLLRKGFSPIKLIGIIVLLGLVGKYFGFL